jgi:large subunit ribosomal protein L1
MPNPKTGTVTTDVTQAINEIKAGKVEFRVDKGGAVHAPVGKLSFKAEDLQANATALINAVVKARPATTKGKYVTKVVICSTMSPSLEIESSELGK